MKSLVIVLLFACFFGDSFKSLERVSILEGTWKVENKETYEHWSRIGNRFQGHSYKMVEGNKHVLETLTIGEKNGSIIYEATVPDQNEGKTIPFRLNPDLTDRLSFENPDHDFPKKIQYLSISEDQIKVMVLGDDDKGFSFIMIKQ